MLFILFFVFWCYIICNLGRKLPSSGTKVRSKAPSWPIDYANLDLVLTWNQILIPSQTTHMKDWQYQFAEHLKHRNITQKISNLYICVSALVKKQDGGQEVNGGSCLMESQTDMHTCQIVFSWLHFPSIYSHCTGRLGDIVAAACWSFSLSQFCCWGLLAD